MHLGINGWPPVASHVACLILGVALTHLSVGQSGRNAAAGSAWSRLPPRSVVLNLPLPGPAKAGDQPGRTGKMHLLRLDSATAPPCRLSVQPVMLLDERRSLVIGMPLAVSLDVGGVAKAAKAGSLRLEAVPVGERTPLCSRPPKVSYGSE